MRIVFLTIACALLAACQNNIDPHAGWATYAGTKAGNRYSSNTQIDTGNVQQLQVAWTYTSHDKDANNRSQLQCNPIVVDNVLYGITPRLKLFALDAATGMQRWIFDPAKDKSRQTDSSALRQVSRGVVYWQSEDGNDKRILYSAGSRLYAVNAHTGALIPGFGEQGSIDLKKGLDRDEVVQAYAAGTTPGVLYKDLLITGIRLSEEGDALPGHIRAFDVRTGAMRWIFHTIPYPGEPGYETWDNKEAYKKQGGANNWAGMALDEKRGIVFIPTGSASPDFYGGFRKGANLYANSIVALEAATGKYIWHYQVVHHDLWDRDLPANPNLVTIKHKGKTIEALAQITKHGYIFVLDRTTGKPVFPIAERPVPQTALPGEQPWPTQPVPSLPEPFARGFFTEADVVDDTAMKRWFRQVKHSAAFSPPSKEGGWIFPGFDGGGEWGGAAVDIETGILYVNSSELPWIQVMIDAAKQSDAGENVGKYIASKYCVSCHGAALEGNGASIPSLLKLEKRMTKTAIRQVILHGRNMMPAIRTIPEAELHALLAFLTNAPDKEAPVAINPVAEDQPPFIMAGYTRFLDTNGMPGIKPPWGTLNAVDLNTGKLLWKVPLGEYPELTQQGMPVTGTENYGGPLVTAGGLVFIAATKDEKIRAFDKRTGAQLWEASLPAAGFATPATYRVDGKQYVVIACGGGKVGNKSGDSYVAFALP